MTDVPSYKKSYRNKRVAALTRMGNICVRCGFSDWRALQIDHKEGDGLADFESIGCSSSSYVFLKYLLNLSDEELNKKYQLLCANCNWIKRYEKNEWRNDALRLPKGKFSRQYTERVLGKVGLNLPDVLKYMEEKKKET